MIFPAWNLLLYEFRRVVFHVQLVMFQRRFTRHLCIKVCVPQSTLNPNKKNKMRVLLLAASLLPKNPQCDGILSEPDLESPITI